LRMGILRIWLHPVQCFL